jgi:predicted 2-oxoglutarate/Fe(II)-dependent dioxygenase YbiX
MDNFQPESKDLAPDSRNAIDLYLCPGFLEPEVCQSIRLEADSSPITKAPVYIQGETGVVHETIRKATSFHPREETVSFVYDEMVKQMAALDEYFGIHLADCEQPQFIRYQPGDFFVRHQDGMTEQVDFDHLRVRRISIVVFLNAASHSANDGGYRGGSLNFYSSWEGPQTPLPVRSIAGETGLLIAFRADAIHEVLPVTEGERFTIVNWFR